MSVRIIDSLPEVGGQLAALYPEKYIFDMPGFPKVTARALVDQMNQQASQFQPEIVLNRTASSLATNGQEFVITTDTGEMFPTKTIIIACGIGAFSPTKLGIESEDMFYGKGLTYGVQNRDALKDKRVLIVGGGDSAIDWCLNLANYAKSVTLVHRRDVFRAHEHSVSQVMQSDTALKLFMAVAQIHGSDHVSGVTLQNTQTKQEEFLECDAIVVNIGFKSSLGPLANWGFEIDKNCIQVDNNFQTRIPKIFAVGDGCTYPNKLKLIATGVGEAATAVCQAKIAIDPESKLFPGHSSDRNL
jgi:thioredoxin reductase (NADPH)